MAETTVISPHDQHVLVNRLRAGDMAAFSGIYQTYTERMITWAINILDDREQAMDTAQDVLLWLWTKRETLDTNLNLEGFLYTSVRNSVLKVIRHGKVKERVFDQIEKRIWGEPTTENMVHQQPVAEAQVRDPGTARHCFWR